MLPRRILPKARIRKSLCSKVIPKVVFWNSFYYRTSAPGHNRKRRPSAKRSWRLWSALSMAMLRMSLWVVDLVDKRIRKFLGWLSGCSEIPLFLTWPSLWYRSVFVCLMRSRYVNNTRNCFNEALMQDVVSMVRGHRTTPTVSLDSQYLPSRTLFASRWGRTFSEPCRHGTRRYVSMSHYFALIHSQEICVAETSLHHALMCIDAEQDPLAFSDPEDVRSQVEWTWQCMAVADCPWASWAPCEFDSVHVFIKDEPSLERAWPHLLKPQLHRQSRKKNHQFRSQ